jgi:Uma2 family endonuclease
MTAAHRLNLVSIDDYLAGELASPVKHEYLGGFVYAMAGATNAHNAIATNTLISLGSRLRGQPCRAFNSDTKIRIRLPAHTRFYYPDVSVTCQLNPPTDSFQDNPVLIAEVLSSSTRRIDEGEKRDAYLAIPSLQVYLLVEQDSPAVVALRRSGHEFVREVYQGLEAVIPLEEIGTSLPLNEVYELVAFSPDLSDDEEPYTE